MAEKQAIHGHEAVETETDPAACDGGGRLGHPRVFLALGDAGEAVCPYCSRHFIRTPGSGRKGH